MILTVAVTTAFFSGGLVAISLFGRDTMQSNEGIAIFISGIVLAGLAGALAYHA